MLYSAALTASVQRMSRTARTSLYILLCALSACCSAQGIEDFKVVVKRQIDGENRYYHELISGMERTNSGLNRSGLRSENQLDYPLPESGCGPTALLNILIWYEKYGLVEANNRNADPRAYKQELFRAIDSYILGIAQESREFTQGTNSAEIGMALDQLVQAGSKQELRIHTDFVKPPLKTTDFLEINKQFRAGYLVVKPKGNGKFIVPENQDHAVTVLRCDHAGNITLGTWGQIYRGRLQMRGEEQWFIPSNPEQLELKIKQMIQFIPFKPITTDADH